ncbi:MAG TPA: hypothetical protein VHE81_18115, partial [Lacipirellulaceae bacterium]|nr:hypothetical protein [Lacipirellulaceae bacterium]
ERGFCRVSKRELAKTNGGRAKLLQSRIFLNRIWLGRSLALSRCIGVGDASPQYDFFVQRPHAL